MPYYQMHITLLIYCSKDIDLTSHLFHLKSSCVITSTTFAVNESL
ncbi:MAG: hypothetical protein AB8U66_00795 [Rickettsiales endosymbiont of Dermacentor nuttalli]